MKIAHVTTSLANGGAEAVMYRLIRADIDNIHIVVSLTGSDIYEQRLKELGVSVYCLQMKGVGFPLKPLLELRRILRDENPDIVQTWMYHANFFGGLAARSLGLRNIFWNLRTSDPKRGEAGRLTHYINLACAKLANRVPTLVIACAHKAKDAHVEFGYPAAQIRTICNGYDLSVMRFTQDGRVKIRAQWGVKENMLLMGIVARWHPQKEHKLLFEALRTVREREHQPWKLVLVGTNMDSNNEELVEHLKNNGLIDHCILAGPQTDIPAVMSALDLHVLASKDEGFPNVIAEAMSCETPCVTTDVGDAAFIVGENGWVSPIGDSDQLATNISKAIELYTQTEQWRTRGKNARLRIEENFSIEAMVDQYHSVWHQPSDKRN